MHKAEKIMPESETPTLKTEETKSPKEETKWTPPPSPELIELKQIRSHLNMTNNFLYKMFSELEKNNRLTETTHKKLCDIEKKLEK